MDALEVIWLGVLNLFIDGCVEKFRFNIIFLACMFMFIPYLFGYMISKVWPSICHLYLGRAKW